ncbi:15655_t:CDS:1 [Entrophospora sp. SA101]|nr:15655_t:CDS:1 [Entrophospora sp. SA101]CAJ0836425.1 8636_t:CDS:1 [Entrophospora sp. SA101]CAJ0838167.1 12359_t:CDS:1 [Entrophospora sp. SA101]CAJ0843091.1 161_t:CDS:1 [Entrophospora sp. SA101]
MRREESSGALNHYWKPPTAEELLVCVLDPRIKKIKFSSQTIQGQTFTLLKTKFMEFSQIESQISTPDNSIPKKIIKSNKIYKPTLLESTFDSQGKPALSMIINFEINYQY